MFYYIASVRFLNGDRKSTTSKAYNYLVPFTLAQKILTALQYSASSSFRIRTSIGDTYRDAGVIFEDFAPCNDYTRARSNYKEIVQITPTPRATAPYCWNISDDRLKRMLDEDLKTYGAYAVKDILEARSPLTTPRLNGVQSASGARGPMGTLGVLPPPIYSNASTGSTAAVPSGSMWKLFEETQDRKTNYPVTDKVVQSIQDSINQLQNSSTTFTIDIPIDPNARITYKNNSDISINPKQKEKSTMFDNIMKDMYFGPYRNKDVRLSMQGMAVKTPEGRYNVYNAQTGALTDVTGFFMDDFGDAFYAIPVAQKEIKVGDVILHNKIPVIVTQIGSNMISVVDPSRGEELKKVPAKSLFGFDFYSKIINAMEGLMGTASADQPFGMLPMIMMMSGDNGGESDSMMKMFLMTQMMGGANNAQMNPMLMIALMGDKGGNDMMKYFMMAEMMKSGGAGFGGMFGAPVAQTAPTAKAPDVKTSKTAE